MAYLADGFVNEGVKVRYPGDATSGTTQLAYRYSSYAVIPLFARPGAQQIGAGGYWYVPAGLFESLRDTAARAGDTVAIAAGKAAEGLETVQRYARFAFVIGALYLASTFLRRR